LINPKQYDTIGAMDKSRTRPKAKKPNNLKELMTSLDANRKELVESLLTKKWFKKTEYELQKELLTLPEDFNGFLEDLNNRPETIGQVEILKLIKLNIGNYIVVPVFKVRSLLTNEIFSYEYASWKYGRFPGYRGLILVEVDNQIKYFLIKKGFKFPIATQIYDAIGTFDISFSKDRFVNLSRSVENKIKKLLGIQDINFRRFIDLGLFNPDAGMTNQHVALFAGIISLDDAKLIQKRVGGKQLSGLAPGFEIEIHPIERLLEYVAKSDDSFFLACVARLSALNIINL
jgi:hypothetical protein